jgi:hypothetical protein
VQSSPFGGGSFCPGGGVVETGGGEDAGGEDDVSLLEPSFEGVGSVGELDTPFAFEPSPSKSSVSAAPEQATSQIAQSGIR